MISVGGGTRAARSSLLAETIKVWRLQRFALGHYHLIEVKAGHLDRFLTKLYQPNGRVESRPGDGCALLRAVFGLRRRGGQDNVNALFRESRSQKKRLGVLQWESFVFYWAVAAGTDFSRL